MLTLGYGESKGDVQAEHTFLKTEQPQVPGSHEAGLLVGRPGATSVREHTLTPVY